jgi:hypothetical protein
MKYEITSTELKCINIIIRIMQEAIKRNSFTDSEVQNIFKTIEILTKRNIK